MSEKYEEDRKNKSGWVLSVIKRLGTSGVGTVTAYLVITAAGSYICSHPVFIEEICTFIVPRYLNWLFAFASYHGVEITIRLLNGGRRKPAKGEGKIREIVISEKKRK